VKKLEGGEYKVSLEKKEQQAVEEIK